MRLAKLSFWTSAGLLAYCLAGYPLLLAALVRLRTRPARASAPSAGSHPLPRVALIAAAHDEQAVIGRWVASALALDYPRGLLRVAVASDGSTDATVRIAREAGADLVLELGRAGKVAALNETVARLGDVDVLAFADANSSWDRDALRHLIARFEDPAVGYVCGRLSYSSPSGDNQEDLYWRYEMAVRELESKLAGVTAGNGAINAVRREAYLFLGPDRGQDISLPFELTKRGWLAVYEPAAEAIEPMAATIDAELGRKRRMMTGSWRTLLATGMLSPRGYSPLYWIEILSHRLLRYAAPILHLTSFAASLRLLGGSRIYALAAGGQAALLAAAALATRLDLKALSIARYYVAVTAASGLGLWDYLRRGTPATWEQAAGTRRP